MVWFHSYQRDWIHIERYKIEDIGIPRKKVGPSEKAAYLAFLFFKDGVRLDGFQIDQKFMDMQAMTYTRGIIIESLGDISNIIEIK